MHPNIETVLELFAQEAGINPSDITLDTPFTSLNLDSLDGILIVMEVEDQFNIDIDSNLEDDLASTTTIDEFINTLGQQYPFLFTE